MPNCIIHNLNQLQAVHRRENSALGECACAIMPKAEFLRIYTAPAVSHNEQSELGLGTAKAERARRQPSIVDAKHRRLSTAKAEG